MSLKIKLAGLIFVVLVVAGVVWGVHSFMNPSAYSSSPEMKSASTDVAAPEAAQPVPESDSAKTAPTVAATETPSASKSATPATAATQEVGKGLSYEEKMMRMMALQERAKDIARKEPSFEETDKLLSDLIEFNGSNMVQGYDLAALQSYLRKLNRIDQLYQEAEQIADKPSSMQRLVELQREMETLQKSLTDDLAAIQASMDALTGAQRELTMPTNSQTGVSTLPPAAPTTAATPVVSPDSPAAATTEPAPAAVSSTAVPSAVSSATPVVTTPGVSGAPSLPEETQNQSGERAK